MQKTIIGILVLIVFISGCGSPAETQTDAEFNQAVADVMKNPAAIINENSSEPVPDLGPVPAPIVYRGN